MSLPNFPTTTAEQDALQVVRGAGVYKPSLKVQEFCFKWNRAARRAGLAATIAVRIQKNARSTTASVVLTNPLRAPPSGVAPPYRLEVAIALPSLGAPPHEAPRPVAPEVSRLPPDQRNIVTVGGSVSLADLEAAKVEAAKPKRPPTDLDVVRACVDAICQSEGIGILKV